MTRQRRSELILAAFHLIATKGLEGLRTRDIAARVGINIATLHYHFASKEALIAAVVRHTTFLFRTQHGKLKPGATPLDELKLLLAGPAHRRRVDSKADVVVQEIMLRSRRDRLIRKALDAMLGGWRRAVEHILERGIAQRVFRPELDARAVATVITSFQIGANMQRGIAGETFPTDRAARSLIASIALPSRRKKPRRK